jgi:predicted RNase H-like HicB family nuclease
MTSSYLVIYERAEDGTVSAYAPELQPGAVISTGRDHDEARAMISEAIALYLEEMRNLGQKIAPSPVRYEVLDVARSTRDL